MSDVESESQLSTSSLTDNLQAILDITYRAIANVDATDNDLDDIKSALSQFHSDVMDQLEDLHSELDNL